MSQIMDGFALAKRIRGTIKAEVAGYVQSGKRPPSLRVIIVGDDPASQTYVASKVKQAKEVGFHSEDVVLETATTESLCHLIRKLNLDSEVDGILVQIPLPQGIDEQTVIESLDPAKDVDGLHPLNVGYLSLNRDGLRPCTPLGIMRLLEEYKIKLEGKRALVIGRSRLVGQPLATLLMHANATVTIAHSKTHNLDALIAQADIIAVAMGRCEAISAESIQENHVLIDVGIHRSPDGLRGDVARGAYTKAAYATPVPRGVGPMTIAMLLENTLKVYKEGIK